MAIESVARTVIATCLNIKPGERVIVIADKLREAIGKALYEAAREITESFFLVMPVGKIDSDEPPQEIADVIKNFDVVIAPTTYSLSHTKAIVEARKNGARVVTLPGINEEMFLRAVDTDYDKLRRFTDEIADKFIGINTIRITSEKGTNIEFSIEGRTALRMNGLAHRAGSLINLPDGEVAFAPVEGSANGIAVIDGSMVPDQDTGYGVIGKIIDPIKITFQNGKAIKIEGGREAAILKEVISKSDENAFLLGEFGVGTNPNAILTGEVLEDEKVLGTAHIALGSNRSFGGIIQSNVHLDGVILSPKIYLDGKEFVVPKISVSEIK